MTEKSHLCDTYIDIPIAYSVGHMYKFVQIELTLGLKKYLFFLLYLKRVSDGILIVSTIAMNVNRSHHSFYRYIYVDQTNNIRKQS